MFQFEYTYYNPEYVNSNSVCQPLPNDIAEDLLLNAPCHVDHEGFDLNKIEQTYYQHNNVSLTHDDIWYKDGGQLGGANAIIQTWFKQINRDESDLIIDHSQFVFRYPIVGAAREQILEYADRRSELLRILSVDFKCGLDMCIDYTNKESNIIEPIVHIEWDYYALHEMKKDIDEVQNTINGDEWLELIPAILRYNKIAKQKKVTAFEQADFRSMILFGTKSYKLIPTL